MPHPKIILFDLDGTLMTCGGAGQVAMESALSTVFAIQPPYDNIPCAGRTDRGICGTVFEMFGVDDTRENRTKFRDAYLEALPLCLERRNARLLPGAESLLLELQRHEEFTMSVLTGNYQAAANIKLQHFNIARYLADGIYGDKHSERDQLAADAVEEFSARMGQSLDGNHFLVIGDTPADVQCARSISAKVIAVATGVRDSESLAAAEPDELLPDLSDTSRVLRMIRELMD